jgi:hypothetical protein
LGILLLLKITGESFEDFGTISEFSRKISGFGSIRAENSPYPSIYLLSPSKSTPS